MATLLPFALLSQIAEDAADLRGWVAQSLISLLRCETATLQTPLTKLLDWFTFFARLVSKHILQIALMRKPGYDVATILVSFGLELLFDFPGRGSDTQ